MLYGGAGGLAGTGSQLITQVGGMIEAGDNFGAALTTADFNRDGFADLAVGAPGETVGSSLVGAGAVSVLYGSAAGLTASGGRLFTQVGSIPNYFEGFGRALAAGDFNRDGFADLAVGTPGQDGGAVSRLGRSACCPARPAG